MSPSPLLKRRRKNRGPADGTQPRFSPTRTIIVPLLCLIVAGAGTWALFEFVIWNRLPAVLVGKWRIVGGPQNNAIFEFERSGNMVAQIERPNTDMVDILQMQVAVDGNKMRFTSRNPNTGQDEIKTQKIRKMTPQELILEDERGTVFRMVPSND